MNAIGLPFVLGELIFQSCISSPRISAMLSSEGVPADIVALRISFCSCWYPCSSEHILLVSICHISLEVSLLMK